MNFELLPDELFFNLFEFINIGDIFRAFRNINHRFNKLLFTHFRTCTYFNFQSISNNDLKIFCHQYLPLATNRLISLEFINNDQTSDKLNPLFSNTLILRNFINLRSLSIHSMNSNQIDQILIECLHLPHISYLKFIQCTLSDQAFNSIWKLPKLTHCHLELIKWNSCIDLQVISVSLKYLYIEVFSYRYDIKLNHLLHHTPHLQYFRIPINTWSIDGKIISTPLLTTLKLSFQNENCQIFDLFKNMPQLYCLSIDMPEFYGEVHRWKQTITTYLPKLKIFQFKTQGQLLNNRNKEQLVDRILDLFRNSFWLDEHQWFVQCHWNLNGDIYLYTLPYTFSYFILENVHTKSTYPCANKYWSFDSVHTLYYEFSLSSNMILPNCYFSNIQDLKLKLPIVNQFLSIIPRLGKLTKLTVSIIGEYNSLQLQTILDRAPHLYSLTFDKWLTTRHMSLAENINKSIRKLDLRIIEYNNRDWYFNYSDCSTLIRSPIGIQCEHLLINVEKRTDIVHLIDSMSNLRKLTVGFREHMEDKLLWPTMNKFIIWLKERLPLIHTITHSRNSVVIQIDR